jgi:hypothetical protein
VLYAFKPFSRASYQVRTSYRNRRGAALQHVLASVPLYRCIQGHRHALGLSKHVNRTLAKYLQEGYTVLGGKLTIVHITASPESRVLSILSISEILASISDFFNDEKEFSEKSFSSSILALALSMTSIVPVIVEGFCYEPAAVYILYTVLCVSRLHSLLQH